jgi:hypothetical protein
VLFTRHYWDDQIVENEMVGAYGTHEGKEKCIQSFARKSWREETIRKM